ncbi:MAG: hypothetical protein A3G93_03405 [Nitrospinae bacterium RIFCSPLOWO2_12_FULL_45_22]|nr:MAG: hypothetical protein A3G93_03405 [Nitrospinae bacterium RIFCSPLOWO2_12_FULL_45_22]
MNRAIRLTLIATIMLLVNLTRGFAVEVAPRISDREIIEGLAAIRADIKVLSQKIDGLDKRIDSLDKRIDGIEKSLSQRIDGLDKRIDSVEKSLSQRIDSLDKRIDSVEKSLSQRIDSLENLMYIMIAGIFGLIGFVVWDRRTALKPAMDRIGKLEREEEDLKRALREYAKQEPGFAEILKNIGIL